MDNNLNIKEISEDTSSVVLPANNTNDALKQLNLDCEKCDNHNIIMDFSLVELITSVSISNLLILNDMLSRKGKRLILTNVAFITKCVFTVTGVDDVFEFSENKEQAISLLRRQPQQN